MSAGYDDRDRDDDDRYDDRPPRRPRDDDEYDDRPRRRGTAAAGRAALPGLFLIINGLIGIILWVGIGGLNLADPMMGVDGLRKFAADQDDPQAKKQWEDMAQQTEDAIKNDPGAYTVGVVIRTAIFVLTNGLAVVGGIMMRSGRSWGLGVAGSVVSVVPCITGCCITGLPFGIWGLVVLLDGEVKAAFGRGRRRYDEA